GLPVRRGRGEPAGDRGTQRVLPAGRPARGVQPPSRSGGPLEEGRGGMGVDGGRGRGDGRRRVRRGAGRTGSEAPVSSPGDGRNVDPSLGVLEGEGAEQETPTDRVVTEGGPPLEVWEGIPSSDGGSRDDPTYFDRPVLKRPVWKWYVPAYFAVGGAAGAC